LWSSIQNCLKGFFLAHLLLISGAYPEEMLGVLMKKFKKNSDLNIFVQKFENPSRKIAGCDPGPSSF